MTECRKCGDQHWIPVRCCDGRMCACYGQPVDIEPCDWCNKNEEHAPEGYAREVAVALGMEDGDDND